MKSLASYKYGGRHKRYLVHRKGLVRAIDPLRRMPVEFATPLIYENWLIHWGSGLVADIQIGPKTWRCQANGRLINLTSHLAIQWLDRSVRPELQTVISAPEQHSSQLQQEGEIVANAHGYNFAIRYRSKIRENEILLDNLDRFRQTLTISDLPENPRLDREILLCLESTEATSVGDVYKRFVSPIVNVEEIDILLFRLHCTGRVQIDLMSERYNTMSRVAKRDHRDA